MKWQHLDLKHTDEEMWQFWGGLFREGDKLVIECVLLLIGTVKRSSFVQIFTGFMFPTLSKSPTKYLLSLNQRDSMLLLQKGKEIWWSGKTLIWMFSSWAEWKQKISLCCNVCCLIWLMWLDKELGVNEGAKRKKWPGKKQKNRKMVSTITWI